MNVQDSSFAGSDLESRIAKVAALRKTAGAGPVPQFAAALRDPDIAVAKTALMGLIDRKAHATPLAELLRDPDPALRWRACTLFWWFPLAELAPRLIDVLLHDAEPMVRAEAAWGLQRSRDDATAAALLKATRDRSRMVAHYAAWNLRVIAAHAPDLPSIKGRKIIPPPLVPENPGRPRYPAAIENGDAAAFRQLAASVPLPACRAPMAEVARIDGRRESGYSAPGGRLEFMDGWPEPPLRKTDFRAACTPDALLLHVRCRFSSKDELASLCTTGGPGVFGDNCIELFLDPTGAGVGPCFHLCINTANALCCVLSPSPHWHVWQPHGLRDDATSWRPAGIRSAVKVEKGFWNAELAIPFADLGLAPARINKVWRLNIVRSAHLRDRGEVTSWCNLGGCDAHRPDLFGYLWVDAGSVTNADAAVFKSKVLPFTRGLKGWTLLRGKVSVADGTIEAAPGSAALRWDEPVPFAQFEVAAEVQLRHQVRFKFAPDPDNAVIGFDGAYLRMINEVHFAHSKGWRDWSPPFPGVLTIHKEVYPRLAHSRWYAAAMRVLRDRCQLLLDGVVHVEIPRPAVEARHFALAFAGGGKVRKLRLKPLE